MTDPAADERVDRLYSVPLPDFTAARNTLAKELRKDGDREGADAVKALKKPSVEAWTVNQLARLHGDEVARLVELGEEQPDVLASGDRDRLRHAMVDVRGTLNSLANHAERILGGSGRKPTPALLERVTRTLQNAAATDDGRAALRHGRFTAEPEPEGLPEVDIATPRPSPRPPKQERAEEEAEQAERAEVEAERSRLERDLRRAEERARLLKEKAQDLERRAAEATEAAFAAEEAVEAARESVVARGGR